MRYIYDLARCVKIWAIIAKFAAAFEEIQIVPGGDRWNIGI